MQRIGATKHQNFKYKHEHRKSLLQVDGSQFSGIHKLYKDAARKVFTNTYSNSWRRDRKFQENRRFFPVKGAVSYFTHIFFSFFLVFLQTSYEFILIKTYKLHYFCPSLYSETTNRGETTVTATFLSGLDLCIFPCFKCIACQVNSFALIAKWFPSTFIILVLFFVRNYRVSHHSCPPLRAPSSSLLCAEAYAWNMTLLL